MLPQMWRLRSSKYIPVFQGAWNSFCRDAKRQHYSNIYSNKPNKPPDGVRLVLVSTPLASIKTLSEGPVGQRHSLYRYKPLQNNQDIRLLRFLQFGPSTEMTCDIVTVPLASTKDKEFIAVSYCWGQPLLLQYLCLEDGSCLPISETLYTLLKYLLSGRSKVMVWIDALCINQKDNTEKDYQVRMMKDIYTAAYETRIWLGKLDVDEQAFMEFLCLMTRDLDDPEIKPISQGLYHTEAYQRRWDASKCRSTLPGQMDLNPNGLGALSNMLWSPWFTRVWVIQEACVGKNIQLQFGNFLMDWEVLMHLVEIVNEAELYYEMGRPNEVVRGIVTPPPAIRTVEIVHQIKRNIERKTPFDMLHLLQCTQMYQATDCRDKIFALLGLTGDNLSRAVFPDYNLSNEEVLLKVGYAITKQGHAHYLMCSGGIASTTWDLTPRPSNLPSWIPNFYSCQRLSGFADISEVQAGGSSSLFEGIPTLDDCPRSLHDTNGQHITLSNTLVCCGIFIDTVKGYGRQRHVTLGDKSVQSGYVKPQTLAFLEEGLEIADALVPYPTGDNAYQMFCKTVSAWSKSTGPPLCDLEEGLDVARAVLEDFEYYTQHLDGEKARQFQKFKEHISKTSAGSHRKIFWTEGRYMGLAHNDIEVGDKICLIKGLPVPFIFRGPTSYLDAPELSRDVALYRLVCDSYICGLMHGEGLRLPQTKEEMFLVW